VKNVVVTKLEDSLRRIESVSLPQLAFCYPSDISDKQNSNGAKNKILVFIGTNLEFYNNAALG
jgi:hypothetical protein